MATPPLPSLPLQMLPFFFSPLCYKVLWQPASTPFTAALLEISLSLPHTIRTSPGLVEWRGREDGMIGWREEQRWRMQWLHSSVARQEKVQPEAALSSRGGTGILSVSQQEKTGVDSGRLGALYDTHKLFSGRLTK